MFLKSFCYNKHKQLSLNKWHNVFVFFSFSVYLLSSFYKEIKHSSGRYTYIYSINVKYLESCQCPKEITVWITMTFRLDLHTAFRSGFLGLFSDICGSVFCLLKTQWPVVIVIQGQLHSDVNCSALYANAYMSYFKEIHVYINDLFQKHAIIWQRYIDDIFCIWKGNAQSLTKFFEYLNSRRME